MKTMLHTATLLYYDGAQIFEGRDLIGGHYIAALIDDANGADIYAVVGASPESLRRFRAGVLDLRTLMLEMPDEQWYIAQPEGGERVPIRLQPQTSPLAESPFLPDEGLFLSGEIVDCIAASEVAGIGREDAKIEGELERANRSEGDWALLTKEGVKSGKIRDGEVSLNGLELGKRYRFDCVEETEFAAGGGETRVLYLKKISAA